MLHLLLDQINSISETGFMEVVDISVSEMLLLPTSSMYPELVHSQDSVSRQEHPMDMFSRAMHLVMLVGLQHLVDLRFVQGQDHEIHVMELELLLVTLQDGRILHMEIIHSFLMHLVMRILQMDGDLFIAMRADIRILLSERNHSILVRVHGIMPELDFAPSFLLLVVVEILQTDIDLSILLPHQVITLQLDTMLFIPILQDPGISL